MNPRRTMLALDALVVALALVPLGWFAALSSSVLAFPHELDYGEGAVFNSFTLLKERGTFYLPIDHEPFVHGCYPPLFYLVAAPFGSSIITLRALSIAAAFTTFACVALALAKVTKNKILAVACASLAIAPGFVQQWSAAARVDAFAVMWSVAAVTLVLAVRERALSPSMLLCALAMFAKHAEWSAPVAILAYAALDPRLRRRIPSLLAWFLGPVVVLFGAGALYTHGEMLLHLGPYLAAAGVDGGAASAVLAALFTQVWPLVVVVAVLAAAAFVEAKRAPLDDDERASLRLASLYLAIAAAGVLRVLLGGASMNHAIEPVAACAIFIGVAAPIAARRFTSETARHATLFAPAVFVLVATYAQPSPGAFSPDTTAARREQRDALSELVKNADGDVLSEEMTILLENGKHVLLEPSPFRALANAGMWDPAPVVADCRAHRWPLVVTSWRLESFPQVGDCVREQYRITATIGAFHVWRPRIRAR